MIFKVGDVVGFNFNMQVRGMGEVMEVHHAGRSFPSAYLIVRIFHQMQDNDETLEANEELIVFTDEITKVY